MVVRKTEPIKANSDVALNLPRIESSIVTLRMQRMWISPRVELAAGLNISQRMIANYESPSAAPPAPLLPAIAQALGVTIDELFGFNIKRRLVKQDGDSRLRRRLLAIDKLNAADKRQVIQLLDAFIERGQLKRKIESRAA
jgi:transcriptional regulator with XRE-family HTH domain